MWPPRAGVTVRGLAVAQLPGKEELRFPLWRSAVQRSPGPGPPRRSAPPLTVHTWPDALIPAFPARSPPSSVLLRPAAGEGPPALPKAPSSAAWRSGRPKQVSRPALSSRRSQQVAPRKNKWQRHTRALPRDATVPGWFGAEINRTRRRCVALAAEGVRSAEAVSNDSLHGWGRWASVNVCFTPAYSDNILCPPNCSSPTSSRTSSDDDIQDRSLLDTVILAQWEDRFEKGLFRYDVTACPTMVRAPMF